MSVFEISFSSFLVLSLMFSVLSVLRGSLLSKTFVCFVSLTVFEISFSFPLEFSLSSSLVFSVLPVLGGSSFPKTLVCLAPDVERTKVKTKLRGSNVAPGSLC